MFVDRCLSLKSLPVLSRDLCKAMLHHIVFSYLCGLNTCGTWTQLWHVDSVVVVRRLSSCGTRAQDLCTQAQLPHSIWNPPRPGTEPSLYLLPWQADFQSPAHRERPGALPFAAVRSETLGGGRNLGGQLRAWMTAPLYPTFSLHQLLCALTDGPT